MGTNQSNNGEWEQDLIQKMLLQGLKEQRRARRWSVFFKLFFVGYLIAILFVASPPEQLQKNYGQTHTALVDINGVIAAQEEASADNIVTGLRAAFKAKNSAGVLVRINSPGGSPVQSGYVYDEIVRLRKLYPEKPVYAVMQDICASGGYYIASAADVIYANKASLVGSIGVISPGFGFVDAMEKLGVERRLLTAGSHKGFMDPFSPRDPIVENHMQSILDNAHQQFKNSVRAGRGERLVDSPEIFSGLIWTGEQALENGLVDALGSTSYVAREIIGAENIVDYTVRLDYLTVLAEQFGVAVGKGLALVLGTDGLQPLISMTTH